MTMNVSIVANVINVAGNCVGVFILHLGAAGVAWPSLLSRMLSAAAVTAYCFRKQNPVRYRRADIWAWDGGLLKKVMGLAMAPVYTTVIGQCMGARDIDAANFYFKKLNKITLVLINNIVNGLAYPFAGSLGNGLRAAGDVKFTMVVSISLTIGARLLDMLHGSIWDKIPRFALPVAATAILVFGALVICRPARRFAAERAEGTL